MIPGVATTKEDLVLIVITGSTIIKIITEEEIDLVMVTVEDLISLILEMEYSEKLIEDQGREIPETIGTEIGFTRIEEMKIFPCKFKLI